jgi:hypothetical protein
VLSYRVTLDVPFQLALFVSRLLAGHRREIGTRAGTRAPADRRWWHVELDDDAALWTMDVRVDEVTGVRFVRGRYPFPSFPGREVLTVEFLGPDGERSDPGMAR